MHPKTQTKCHNGLARELLDVLGDMNRDVFGAAMIRAQLAKRTTVE